MKIIPLLVLKGEENLSTLLFQLREMRKIMFELLSRIRNDGNKEQINSSLFLKNVFSSLDDDTMYEIKYLMSCVVTFPVSEAIVESWGSVIDKVINDKVAFAESVDVSRIDITEKFVFIKIVGPSAGSISNRKLFKRALTLMYGGKDYAKHFMRPHGKGFTSKVVSKLTFGDPNDCIFF